VHTSAYLYEFPDKEFIGDEQVILIWKKLKGIFIEVK